MTTSNLIAKSLKVTFPKKVYILPFEGNLTKTRKDELATRLQIHMNKYDKRVSLEYVQKIIWHDFYGRVERDLTIEENESRFNLRGQGWSSSNMPKKQLIILH